MGMVKKLKTAGRVFHEEGFEGIFKIIKQKMDRNFTPDELEMAFEVLEANAAKGIMFDIGAHYGSSLIPFAKAGWNVFAFEPDALNREHLLEAVEGMVNVTVDARAVSDYSETKIPFYRSKESSGVSGLSAFLQTHESVGSVDTVTLANFIQEKKLESVDVDFLKIDTEGYDLMVLKGFPWETKRPRLILCEFEDSKTIPLGYTFHVMADFLIHKGYKLVVSEWQPIEKYGEKHHWRGFSIYPCKLQHARAWGNIFAVQDEDMFKKLTHLCELTN